MEQGKTSQSRAMRLLAALRERTEHAAEPVLTDELATASQLTIAEAQAAWRYLRDLKLIQTYDLEYAARINARGIDALDKAAAGGVAREMPGEAPTTLQGSTARGYGRVDSRESLDRAREVSKELVRLHAILPDLTNSELSAYSTKSLPIGTFLTAKGHVFSVLTEEMLAQEFKEELERRKGDTTADRWLKRIKNNPVVAIAVILAIVIGGVAGTADSIDKWWSRIHPLPAAIPDQRPLAVADMDTELARDTTIQIDLCAFARGAQGQVVECVTHGACRGPGSLGLGFPIDKTSKESAIYTCKQSCASEAKNRNATCSTPPPF